MISVRVRTIMSLKKVMGKGEVELSIPEGTSVEGLLLHITDKWGEDLARLLYEPGKKKPFPYIRFMVNGQDLAFLDGMDTRLDDGDEILIIPPVGGG